MIEITPEIAEKIKVKKEQFNANKKSAAQVKIEWKERIAQLNEKAV